VAYWWPVGPILLAILAVAWVRSGTTAGLRGGGWGGLRRLPWMGSLVADYESANFAELLALLLENRVPYPSALVLAGEATGAPRLAAGARRAAEAMTRGEPAAAGVAAADPRAFPAMLRWTLATGQVHGSLGASLEHLADLYRKRARHRADQVAVFLPMILTMGIGAGAASFYGLCLFMPLVEMLNGLSTG
jgi:general secretion pathway protein F